MSTRPVTRFRAHTLRHASQSIAAATALLHEAIGMEIPDDSGDAEAERIVKILATANEALNLLIVCCEGGPSNVSRLPAESV